MKVVYHPRYEEVYTSDPAAKAGRMESITREVSLHFEFATPEPASLDDVRLAHSEGHIDYIRKRVPTCEIALLAAGGAITAAEMAVSGEPAFGLIRPPGHHASRNHCWGFCYFNNVAISIARLRQAGKVNKALILDIDLHYGDGTDDIFSGVPEVAYFHPEGRGRRDFVDQVSRCLDSTQADIVAVSAGFDRHVHDWGRLLDTEDYRTIGRLVKDWSERHCRGRRYGVLEGGYNQDVLGRNVKALLDGMT